MKSFDFYDTLFVRLIAEPRGVFELIELSLALPGFCEHRQKAERRATSRLGAREITLQEIYNELQLDAETKAKAMALEQHLEAALLSPVTDNLDCVTSRDMVVSDMYLPQEFFTTVISRALPPERQPSVVVSSNVGKRKSDGRLWEYIVQSGLRPQSHLGDNWVSDVKRARQFKIEARHYLNARLNRFEKNFLGSGLSGSVVAGVSRATRLAARFTCDAERRTWGPLIDVFASVFAPLIVSFVEHIVEDASRRGLKDLFFLSRDGQLPYLVACKIVAQRSLALRPRYIYGSRQSLHMAGYTSPEAAAPWLLEDTLGLSIADIAARANVALDVFRKPAEAAGIHDLTRALSPKLRGRLIEILNDEVVAATLRAEADRQWRLANSFYRSAGFRPGSSVALVDVGWNGRMQRSLNVILAKDGLAKTTIVGYYLCLSSKARLSDDEILEGFLHDPEQAGGQCPYDPYRPVIEASLSADHGTTTGFKWDGQVVPEFGPPPGPVFCKAVLHQQETVLRFTDLLMRVEKDIGYRVGWDRDAVRRALLMFLRTPSLSEARAFASHKLDVEQVESQSVPLVCSGLAWRSMARGQPVGHWPEGSAALSGRRDVMALIRAARFVRKVAKRRTTRK